MRLPNCSHMRNFLQAHTLDIYRCVCGRGRECVHCWVRYQTDNSWRASTQSSPNISLEIIHVALLSFLTVLSIHGIRLFPKHQKQEDIPIILGVLCRALVIFMKAKARCSFLRIDFAPARSAFLQVTQKLSYDQRVLYRLESLNSCWVLTLKVIADGAKPWMNLLINEVIKYLKVWMCNQQGTPTELNQLWFFQEKWVESFQNDIRKDQNRKIPSSLYNYTATSTH